LAEQAAGLAAGLDLDRLPAAKAGERERLAAGTGDAALPADADEVAQIVRLVHGDVTARSEAWLRWLDEELCALLRWREPQVRRLAAAALHLGTVGAEAAARLLEQP
ncbi:MAG TPA: hypothetical protein VKV80_04580, partial [Streptosporangiaceae bacterium]|nr:hypothetical protein [Streptosporangiaceae bacterium]